MWHEPVTSRAAPKNSSSTVVALFVGAARSLEDDREAYSILGHQRRFPPAATALVEQIGKRILVIAGVTCQPNNHGLVFFHPREISSFPAMDTTPAYPTLRIVSHPLIQHKLTILRDRATPTKIFRELVDEIAMLMAYEATNDLALESAPVDTPLESTKMPTMSPESVIFCGRV